MQLGVAETIIAIVAAWMVIYLVLSYVGAKLTPLRNVDAYLTGGRTAGILPIWMIMLTGTTSGFAFVGVTGFAGLTGLFAASAIWWWVLGFILCASLVWYPANILGRKYGYNSCADLFMDRYESKGLGLLLAIIWLIYTIPYMMVQVIAAGTLWQAGSGGILPYETGIIFMALVFIIYTYIGGLRGLLIIGIAQGILILIMQYVILGFGVASIPDGMVGAYSWLATHHPELLKPGYWSVPMGISWLFFLGAGWVTWAHILPRAYAIRDPATTRKVIALFALTAPFICWLHWGLWPAPMRYLVGKVPPDYALPTILYKYCPLPITGLGIAAGLAACMSTAATMLISMGGIIGREIYQTWINPNASERRILWVTRIFVLIWGAIVLLLSLKPPAIIVVIAGVSMAGTLVLLFPMITAIWWPRANKYGAIAGIIAGEIVVAFQVITGYTHVSPWFGFHISVWGLLACAVVQVIVTYLTPPPSEEVKKKFHGYLQKRILGK